MLLAHKTLTNILLSRYKIIQFPVLSVNPESGVYNSAEHSYQCQTDSNYFFTFTAGVPAGQTSQLVLEGLSKTYAAQRLSTNTNGLTTISRSVLVPCNKAIKLVNNFGKIESGESKKLISLQVFPYFRTGESVSWAAYKINNAGPSDPLNFEEWLITQNTNQVNNIVTISKKGFYYVYISIGTSPNNKAKVTLRRNSEIIFSIDRQSTNHNGIDVLGHGMVIEMEENDRVRVVVEPNSSIVSNSFGYHTSFLGFLIYE